MGDEIPVSSSESTPAMQQIIYSLNAPQPAVAGQADRVNPVPPGGTITINGKRPIVLLFMNGNPLPVQVHTRIANYSDPTSFSDQYIIINPNSSLSYNIDIDLGPGGYGLIYYHIDVTNMSNSQINLSYSDSINYI